MKAGKKKYNVLKSSCEKPQDSDLAHFFEETTKLKKLSEIKLPL